ncbi:Tubulin [Carpediemonas membranifera]|uniref:Tubulin n=1 Tax=Carpediemonas membranifera TaxID=201153 RepID=A0A8J6BCM1_9EUKA|nr:Tubulin [Carpediemonas membranifera]|eukprot:KAG9394647.1 Tubulin [Carpediemonas membranifera]
MPKSAFYLVSQPQITADVLNLSQPTQRRSGVTLTARRYSAQKPSSCKRFVHSQYTVIQTITICVGQCGLQVGLDFWTALAKEYGISVKDGKQATNSLTTALPPAAFFHYGKHTDGSRKYVPRAILLDLEPGVLADNKETLGFMNPANIVTGEHFDAALDEETKAAGAGNNWAHGFTKAPHVRSRRVRGESVMQIVKREVSHTNRLDSFLVVHSVAGGTGSGMGSWVIEQLRLSYPSTSIATVSVFPNASDVTVQPYNMLLTLRRLISHTDAAIIVSNENIDGILQRQAAPAKGRQRFDNDVILRVMLGWTAAIRTPTQRSAVSELIRMMRGPRSVNLFCPSCAPVRNPRIIRAKALMASFVDSNGYLVADNQLALPRGSPGDDLSKSNKIITALTVFQNTTESVEAVEAAVGAVRPAFAPWAIPMWKHIQTASSRSPKPPSASAVTVVSCSGMAHVLRKVEGAVSRMLSGRSLEQMTTEQLKKVPFMDTYLQALGAPECLDQFQEAYTVLTGAIELYTQAAHARP